jgi:hypothetical protein
MNELSTVVVHDLSLNGSLSSTLSQKSFLEHIEYSYAATLWYCTLLSDPSFHIPVFLSIIDPADFFFFFNVSDFFFLFLIDRDTILFYPTPQPS